jgi:hypothetical protein
MIVLPHGLYVTILRTPHAMRYTFSMWQDFVLAIIIWILLAALIPTVLHRTQKPTLSTGILTGTALAVIAFTYVSMELWNSALASAFISAAWFLLAYQRYKLNKQSETK